MKKYDWRYLGSTITLGKRAAKDMLYLWWTVTSKRRKNMVVKEMNNRFMKGRP